MLTKLIVSLTIVGLIVYDVFAGSLGQPTESSVLRDWARDWSILPFIAGFLVGHWFAPRQIVDVSVWTFMLPVFAILIIIDLIMYFKYSGYYPGWRYSLWYVLLGIPFGMYIWGQPGYWSPIK
jgi:hypothetical protein